MSNEQRAVRRYGLVGVKGGLAGCKNGCLSSASIIEQRDGKYALASELDALSTELAEAKAEIERMRVDAQRWRATVGSARVRVLGSAGVAEPRPDGNAHIGVELWTSYNDPNYLAVGCEHDRQRLTQYADIAALIPAKGKGE